MKPRFQFPKWFDRQISAQVILVILFMLVCLWIWAQPNPFDTPDAPQTPQANQVLPSNPTQLALKATAYSIEINENRDQTLGILFGGTMLVVMVIGGTLLVYGKH
ncbi:MAG TPA: hypothetical protein VF338_10760 [Leptolinea sp.]